MLDHSFVLHHMFRRASVADIKIIKRIDMSTTTIIALFHLHKTRRSLGDIIEQKRTIIGILGLNLGLLLGLDFGFDLGLDVRDIVVRVRVGLDLALLGGTARPGSGGSLRAGTAAG